ncbi:MAG: HAD family phosphatase [Methylococcales bacterium]|nr:HAD family phosphatase [Methylococcales bacterium]
MTVIFRPRALIFDMDGLVLDSETTYFAAWRQAATDMGYRLDDEFLASVSGLPGDRVMAGLSRRYGEGFDLAAFGPLSQHAWLNHVRRRGIPVKPGFFSLLKRIGDLRLPYCLATNSRRADALYCLRLAGLEDVFQAMVCGDDVGPNQSKPAPDIFLKAAALLETDIADCLVLEDSASGVLAAVAAGAPCLFIPSVQPADSRVAGMAWRVLDNLEQVCGLIS